MGYASDTLMRLSKDTNDGSTAWTQDFKRLVSSARLTTLQMTSLICLLSASITNRQPLPPYLKAPQPYSFDRKLDEIDRDILTIKHIAEPGFAAFAVFQISARCIAGDVHRLLR